MQGFDSREGVFHTVFNRTVENFNDPFTFFFADGIPLESELRSASDADGLCDTHIDVSRRFRRILSVCRAHVRAAV
jgi:hypothetical protein